jgi:hypothetical protein
LKAVDTHYFFPPARAYALNRCLYRLKSDNAFRGEYLADPVRAMDQMGLDHEARTALRALDPDRLVALGAHPYLVFMASLRLRMVTEPASFERF